MEGVRDGLKQSNETVVSAENGSKISLIAPVSLATQECASSRPAVSCHQQPQANLEEEEELMLRNFPWLKVEHLSNLS